MSDLYIRSATARSVETSINVGRSGEQILPPFTRDHDGPGHRRARLIITAILLGFCLIYGFAFALFAPFAIVFFAAPPAMLLLISIWALPDSSAAPTGILFGLLVTFMFCLVVWPNYIALSLPSLPWITMARLTGFPLALVLLLCVSTSPAVRSDLAAALRASSLVWRLFLAFNLIAAISIAFSASVFLSLDKFILAQVGWSCVFLTSAYAFQRSGRVERMARLLWLMAIIVGVIGAVEWRYSHILWANHIPPFLKIVDESVLRILAGNQRFTVYRVVSTFSTPLALGEYMALATPFILQFAVGNYVWRTKILAYISVIFVLFVAKISGSRLGLVGCLLALALSFGVWAFLKWRRREGGLFAPAVVFTFPIGLVFGISVVALVGRLRHLVWGNGSQSFSDHARVEQWMLGLPKILSHPQGYGIGMGAATLGYAPFGLTTIDSYYLSVFLEFGVVGFLVFYGMICAAIYYSVIALLHDKTSDRDIAFLAPVAIALTNFLIIKSVFSQLDNQPIMFMILGLAAALVYRSKMAATGRRDEGPLAT